MVRKMKLFPSFLSVLLQFVNKSVQPNDLENNLCVQTRDYILGDQKLKEVSSGWVEDHRKTQYNWKKVIGPKIKYLKISIVRPLRLSRMARIFHPFLTYFSQI